MVQVGIFSKQIQYSLAILTFIFIFQCKPNNCPKINHSFPEFSPIEWLQSETQSISDLEGKVILIRWWTDGCVFCINSKEALNEWYSKYRTSEFEIIGMYHPKPRERRPSTEEIQEYISKKGFQFPIVLDLDWNILDRLWNTCGQKEFTSVSFLIDRKGVLRYIHSGGEYHIEKQEGHEKCVIDYFQLDSTLQRLLTE